MSKHRTGHLFKRGDNFYVRWTVNGKVFSRALRGENGKPITQKREAEEARVKAMAPYAVGDEADALEAITAKLEGRRTELARLQDELNPPLRVVKAWVEYLKSPNRPDTGESTMEQYEFQWNAFERWVKEKHGEDFTMRDVAKEIAEDYAATLNAERFSPGTYNKHLNLVTLVFRVLKDKAKLESNPWADIQRKRLAPHSRRELTLDELRKVCESATGELRTLFALGVYTGLRRGDCATLRWAEVDLARKVIRRVPNKTARLNPKPVIVPIHPTLHAMLAETPADQRGEYVLPELALKYIEQIHSVTRLIQKHFRDCGISLYKPGTGKDGKRAVIEVGFHSLRHTFVSLCRESNAPLAVVESIVGHSNPSMTRHYTHVGEIAAGKAVAALPAVIGPSEPAQQKHNLLDEVRDLLSKMTARNWKRQKEAALGLMSETTP